MAADDMQGEDTDAPSDEAGGEQDSALEQEEQRLTQNVQHLIETMNRSSGEVNTYTLHLTDAQEEYKKLHDQLKTLHEELREKHGQSSLDKVRPYFDATQALTAASSRVQVAVREFSAASSLHSQAKSDLRRIEEDFESGAFKISLDSDQQDGLSKATVRVLKCQQERDHREQEYARVLRDFQDAQESVEAVKKKVGDDLIKRTMPSFRQLQKHQQAITNAQSRINALTERTRLSKASYHNSMRELDKISTAVHELRKEHKQRMVEQQGEEAKPKLDVESSSPQEQRSAQDDSTNLDEIDICIDAEDSTEVADECTSPLRSLDASPSSLAVT